VTNAAKSLELFFPAPSAVALFFVIDQLRQNQRDEDGQAGSLYTVCLQQVSTEQDEPG